MWTPGDLEVTLLVHRFQDSGFRSRVATSERTEGDFVKMSGGWVGAGVKGRPGQTALWVMTCLRPRRDVLRVPFV